MINIDKIMGRLGNKMFMLAYIYAKTLDYELSDIYLQDPAYFDSYREEIRKLYGTPTEMIDYVAIHVRRGDYVNNPFYVDLTKTDYYKKAMAEFPEGSKFVVFSDDIPWCLNNFEGIYSFYSNGNEIEDMNAMSSCKGIIMANSSYSWWASYLSNAEKIIAPSVENWYSDGIERTKCPEEWIRI